MMFSAFSFVTNLIAKGIELSLTTVGNLELHHISCLYTCIVHFGYVSFLDKVIFAWRYEIENKILRVPRKEIQMY